MSWQSVPDLSSGKLKTISINLEVWTMCQIQLSFVWMLCDPLTNNVNKLIHFCPVLCEQDLWGICIPLGISCIVRGINPNFCKSGLVGVLVGRSYIILAALFCSLKNSGIVRLNLASIILIVLCTLLEWGLFWSIFTPRSCSTLIFCSSWSLMYIWNCLTWYIYKLSPHISTQTLTQPVPPPLTPICLWSYPIDDRLTESTNSGSILPDAAQCYSRDTSWPKQSKIEVQV